MQQMGSKKLKHPEFLLLLQLLLTLLLLPQSGCEDAANRQTCVCVCVCVCVCNLCVCV